MNKNDPGWPDDPVIEEIRAIRRKLWKEAGGTVAGYIRLIEGMAQQKPQSKRRPASKPHAKRPAQATRGRRNSRA